MSANEEIPQGINDTPDPALFAPAENKKQRREKRPVDEGGSLSINSLMDIMTIILVFLIKSYSTDPVQLKQAKDLKPPFSISDVSPAESTTLTITLNNLMVNDMPVLSIENGVVAESDRSSGGFLIDPLFQKLQEEVDHQKRVAKFNKTSTFSEVITIIADRHIPFNLLSQVMYTAGQAQFGKFKFMVVKG